jgi:D-amino peptidase
VLAHTVEVEISEQRLNGVLVGECGIFAAMAGQFGVPTTLVTGDDVTCAEARDLLGDIEVAEVKRGLGWNQAICLPLAETAALIRARAAAAVRRSREIKPYRVEPPFVIRTAYNTWEAIMKADRRVSGTALAQRVDERTVEIRSDNLTEAFNLSW